MFAGWTVYIHLEPRKRKCFSRIICGGGGRVYSREDLRRRLPDFVLVEKTDVKEARALVGPRIPLVNTSFIIETLVMKRDPRDIEPYVIDIEEITGNEGETRVMGDVIQDAYIIGPDNTKDNPLMSQGGNEQHISKTGLSGIKRPYNNGEVSRNEKTSTSRQPSIGGLFSNSKLPMKNESFSSSDSPRKKKFKKRYSSEKCMDIRSYLNTGNDLRGKRSEHNVSDESDIVTISEEPTRVTSDKIDSSGVNLQTSKVKQKKNNTERTGPLDFLDKKIEEKENVCNLSLTRVGSESGGYTSRVNDISKLDELPSGKGDGRVTSSIDKTHLTQNEILENDGKKSVKSVSNLCLKSGTNNGKSVREMSNFNMVITMSHMTDSKIEMSQRKEMELALKSLEINGCSKDLQSGEIANFSHESLSSSSSKYLHFDSNDIKSAVMTLVKKQRMSCSTLTKVIQPCYPNRSNLAVVVLDDRVCEPEEICTELALQETAFFEESTDEDVTGADEEIILDGIDSLFLNISIRKFPPAWIMGRILSQLALKVDSEFVHQRAIDLAYQILTLHPPSSTKKRLYYYTAFTFGMQAGEDHHNRAWMFVRDVITSALTLKIAGGEAPKEAQRASELLQFLLTLLQQDFQMWDRRIQNVSSLITVQLLWGKCSNLNVITPNIKDLIRLWVESINSTPDVQSFLGGLMSVLLEVVVAGTDTISFAGNQIILTSYILPIAIYMQDLDMNSKMKLVGNLSSPWIRSLVYRNLLCEIHKESGQEITETGLKAMLKKSEEVVFDSQTELEKSRFQTDVINKQLSSKIRGRKNTNKRSSRGETQLMCACITNNIPLVKECLASPGVKVNLLDNAGRTALHNATLHGNVECVKLLLEFTPPSSSSSDINSLEQVNLHAKGEGGHTALHDAVQNGYYDIAKLLLEYGGEALLNEKTTEGKTPLDCAKTSAMSNLLKSYIKDNSFNNSDYFNASPRKRKCHVPIHVAMQPEDYVELLVAAISSYVTHMELMSICSLLYTAQRKTSSTSDDFILLEENSVEEERAHEIVEKLFPIIESDLSVVQNPDFFLDKINLPMAKDLLMFSLSR
ncbi:uncharacterized protein LOC143023739 [Oratosquilla oratoria]|uniref:uncharacterized protein LOC143023739 n=1 Tax=Oratosquilla oratoria TaxID=337810 RepID=UPI003F767D9F